MVGLLGAGLTSFALHPERDLDQAADGLGAAGLVILSGGPIVDVRAHLLRQADGRYRILPGRWAAWAFPYYVFL